MEIPAEVPLSHTGFVIGRQGADLSLTSGYVSRKHAQLQRTATGWRVLDTSTNGLCVNNVNTHTHTCMCACVHACVRACMRVCIFLHVVGHSRQCHGCVKYSSCAMMQGYETPAFANAFPSLNMSTCKYFAIAQMHAGVSRGGREERREGGGGGLLCATPMSQM